MLAGRSGSLAVTVNCSSVSSSTLLVPIGSSTGGIVDFADRDRHRLGIRQVRLPVVRGGEGHAYCPALGPRSASRRTRRVAGSNVAPAGSPAADSVTSLAGTSSGSLAVTVNCSSVSSSTLLFPIGASTGGVVDFAHRDRHRLGIRQSASVVRGREGHDVLPGPWASLGVQANTPVAGSNVAPAGSPADSATRVGRHVVRVAGRDRELQQRLFVHAPVADRVQHRRQSLTSPTVIVTVSESVRFGVPSSVAVKVTT